MSAKFSIRFRFKFPLHVLVLILVTMGFVSPSGISRMIGREVPEITGKTIQGLEITPAFFKGKITLINFMYIGCPPCMVEINTLDKLKSYYEQQGTDFQILCIAPQTAFQMISFNGEGNLYSSIRHHFKARPISYMILPECPSLKRNQKANTMQPQCKRISQKFKVNAYPSNFLVDSQGIIRFANEGFFMSESDSLRMDYFKSKIDPLLTQMKNSAQ